MKVNQMNLVKPNIQSRTEKQNNVSPVEQKTNGNKALSLSLAALATVSFAGLAMNKTQSANASVITKPNNSVSVMKKSEYNNFKMDDGVLAVDFITPKEKTLDFSSMQKPFNSAQEKLGTLRKTDAQYSWIDMPSTLIKNNYVDSVYQTVNEFKKPFNQNTKLIFVALGNPSNTDEIAKSMGLGANLVYSCDMTTPQIKDTIKKAGNNLGNIQIIISSKSGSTFESNQTYKLLLNEFKEYYAKKGVAPENVQKEISKHFLFVTDKNPEKSKLKDKAQKEGITTIDAIDGLHSAFGDLAYSMPILAYLGLPEDSAKRMLSASQKMSEKLLSAPLDSNMAGKIAAYDKFAIDNGATKEQFIFHDAHFTDFSMTEKQIYKESLRKLDFVTNVFPRDAHAGLESDVSRGLDKQQISNITNLYVRNSSSPNDKEEMTFVKSVKNLNKAHELNIQKEGHFQKNIELSLSKEGLSPESVGEYMTLKSFVAFFKNEFENQGKTDLYNQSYVKGYKKIREDLESDKK